MGAISADVPAIQLVTGRDGDAIPRANGLVPVPTAGAFWGKYRAGEVSDEGIDEIEASLPLRRAHAPSWGRPAPWRCYGGTGYEPSGHAAIPAVHADSIALRSNRGCAMK